MLYHRWLARGLGLRIETAGAPLVPNALIVANHVSWTDIIALGAVAAARFVAKAEVRRWPLLGALARLNPAVFVERALRHDVPRQIRALGDALADGSVILFPEGTTSDGAAVLPFRTGLFEAAAGRMIQPVTICYAPADRRPWRAGELAAFAWDGDKSFWPHVLAVSGGPGIVCRLIVHPPFAMRAGDRKAAAAQAWAAIAASIRPGAEGHSTAGRT